MNGGCPETRNHTSHVFTCYTSSGWRITGPTDMPHRNSSERQEKCPTGDTTGEFCRCFNCCREENFEAFSLDPTMTSVILKQDGRMRHAEEAKLVSTCIMELGCIWSMPSCVNVVAGQNTAQNMRANPGKRGCLRLERCWTITID